VSFKLSCFGVFVLEVLKYSSCSKSDARTRKSCFWPEVSV